MEKHLFSFLVAVAMTVLLTNTAIAQKYRAIIYTDYGKMKIELYDKTPVHRDNFIKLAQQHFYDGLLFHRVIPQFMIQSGDPDSKTAKPGQLLGEGDLDYRLPAEFIPQYFHKRGALAQARDDNPQKESSAAQFYIVTGKKFTDEDFENLKKKRNVTVPEERKEAYRNIGGAPHLDGNYTVYGQVLSGMEIADSISAAQKDKNDRPLKDNRIKTIKIRKKFLGLWL